MNVYGFTDIEFNDEGGASILIERRGVVFAIPVITPEPGQKVEAFSPTGNPPGVIVTQADGQLVWVFMLHGRLFATRNLNANPHMLWLSWAFVQRFTGLRKPNGPGRTYRPVMVSFDTLILPEEGKTASGNKYLDEVMRKAKLPLTAEAEKVAVFRDRMYETRQDGSWRRLRGDELALAQKLIMAAA
jgi:hypothetical protein